MGKSKWESLVEIDRRFGRRSAELRAARTPHEAMTAHVHHADDANLLWGPPPGEIGADGMPVRARGVDVVTGPTPSEAAPPSAWWGVALVALAILCVVAFSLCGQ